MQDYFVRQSFLGNRFLQWGQKVIFQKRFNPIQGGLITSYSGVCVIDDTKVKFYMVIDNHELFPKIEKELGWKCWLCSYDVIIMQILADFRPHRANLGVLLNR